MNPHTNTHMQNIAQVTGHMHTRINKNTPVFWDMLKYIHTYFAETCTHIHTYMQAHRLVFARTCTHTHTHHSRVP